MLFAQNENSPWWVAGIMAAIGIAYALTKVYYHIKDSSLRHNLHDKREREAQQAESRREAAKEAWEVVDRLTAEVESHTVKLEALEERYKKLLEEADRRERAALERVANCEARHAHTVGRLSIVEAWARSRGLKIPLPPDSSTHTPLPPTTNSEGK